MQWKIHGERPVYENSWVNLWLTGVETPDGNRWERECRALPSGKPGGSTVKSSHKYQHGPWPRFPGQGPFICGGCGI